MNFRKDEQIARNRRSIPNLRRLNIDEQYEVSSQKPGKPVRTK